MKLIYTNESIFLVNNVKNLVEAQGIESFIKNEFAQGAAGVLSVFDSWPELWVVNDADFELATNVVSLTIKSQNTADWLCEICAEENDASFDLCWKCNHEKPSR